MPTANEFDRPLIKSVPRHLGLVDGESESETSCNEISRAARPTLVIGGYRNQPVDADNIKEKQLDVAYKTLMNYARDLRAVIDTERKVRLELSDAYYQTLIRLAQATALKDGETGAHLQRISYYSKMVALMLGYSEERAQLLFDAAPMHDVGKMGIPDAILQKKGPLDNVEWDQMKRHTELGASLLGGSSSKLLRLAETIALCHHERWDGTGYPRGLVGKEIPEEARIVMLVDQYDALRSKRPYKLGFDHETTCRIILQGDKRSLPQHFDPRLLDLFQTYHTKFELIWRRFHSEEDQEQLFGSRLAR